MKCCEHCGSNITPGPLGITHSRIRDIWDHFSRVEGYDRAFFPPGTHITAKFARALELELNNMGYCVAKIEAHDNLPEKPEFPNGF